MQIKSWQIALVGNIPTIGLLLIMIVLDISNSNIPGGFLLLAGIIGLIVLSIPILLLKYQNEKLNKIGGLTSIFFGIVGGLYYFAYFSSSFFALEGYLGVTAIIPILSVLVFLISGIYYFWKKV